LHQKVEKREGGGGKSWLSWGKRGVPFDRKGEARIYYGLQGTGQSALSVVPARPKKPPANCMTRSTGYFKRIEKNKGPFPRGYETD